MRRLTRVHVASLSRPQVFLRVRHGVLTSSHASLVDQQLFPRSSTSQRVQETCTKAPRFHEVVGLNAPRICRRYVLLLFSVHIFGFFLHVGCFPRSCPLSVGVRMRKLRLLFLVGLASCFISEKLMVSAQASFSTDDIYLEGRPSGDIPVDDEDDKDGGSGSGSGDYYPTDEEIPRRSKWSDTTSPTYKEVIPTRATQTTAADSQDQTTTVKPSPYIPYSTNREQEVPGDILPDSTSQMPFRKTTEAKSNMDNSPEDSVVVVVVDEDEIVQKDGRGGLLQELDVPEQVSTENMWERTDVLAAVIACGVVGFLCAVSLLLLLAYRMKKKDEGSYELGDTKLSTTAYQKAPTKEFYA